MLASPPRPTELQLELLRVGLWEPEAALATWKRVRSEFVLDDVWDADTHRLMPLVYRKLAALGIDDPDLPRLRGLHRREWYQNQVRVARLGPLLGRLQDAGIDTMVLHGVPLALRYYGDLGARPMDHADVLVPTARATEALALLAADGWQPYDGRGGRVPLRAPVEMLAACARMLDAPDGPVVELGWHLGAPFVLPGRELRANDDFWLAAEPIDVADVTTRTLNAGDQVLHVIGDGLAGRDPARTCWVADAFVVLAGAAGIDWDRFVDRAESRRLAPLAGWALEYLVDALDAPVPSEIPTRLARVRPTRHDWRALEASFSTGLNAPAPRGGMDLGPMWAWRRAKLGRYGAAYDLPRFLRDRWHLSRATQMPFEAMRRLGRRVRRRVLERRRRAA